MTARHVTKPPLTGEAQPALARQLTAPLALCLPGCSPAAPRVMYCAGALLLVVLAAEASDITDLSTCRRNCEDEYRVFRASKNTTLGKMDLQALPPSNFKYSNLLPGGGAAYSANRGEQVKLFDTDKCLKDCLADLGKR